MIGMRGIIEEEGKEEMIEREEERMMDQKKRIGMIEYK